MEIIYLDRLTGLQRTQYSLYGNARFAEVRDDEEVHQRNFGSSGAPAQLSHLIDFRVAKHKGFS